MDKPFEYKDTGVTLFTVEKESIRKPLVTGDMTMTNDKKSVGDVIFNLADIENMTILGKHKMNLYNDGITYQFIGDDNLNVVKYLHMYCHLYNKEETV